MSHAKTSLVGQSAQYNGDRIIVREGTPQRRWLDDIREKSGRYWHQMPHNKEAWKTEEETYVEE